jgi:hypothetical protein
VDVTEVLGTIDNPVLFVAGGEIQDLFVGWQDNGGRDSYLAAELDDVFPGVMNGVYPKNLTEG